ncbi:MAG: 30S ribosomal protein S6 [Balneola sp.]|nr:MAG: 30S ribosomal protein S6 [Balneola sp.]
MSKNHYELTYILNPVLEEDQFKAAIEKINKLITDNGGEIEEVDEWGLRKFAYEMDKKGNGYYVNTYFSGPAAVVAAYERFMRIEDEYMRYLTLKLDAKMLRHRELVKNNAVPSIFAVEEEAKAEA